MARCCCACRQRAPLRERWASWRDRRWTPGRFWVVLVSSIVSLVWMIAELVMGVPVSDTGPIIAGAGMIAGLGMTVLGIGWWPVRKQAGWW